MTHLDIGYMCNKFSLFNFLSLKESIFQTNLNKEKCFSISFQKTLFDF